MSFPRYRKYKDSGVEWLGEVPGHWDVKALKNVISRIESGVSVNAIDTPAAEGEIGVLKTSCVYRGWFDPAENKAVVPEEYERVACPVTAGTLIVSRMNTPDLVGAAGMVGESNPGLFLPDRLWQVHFADAHAAFIHYWTHSPLYRAQVQQVCAGASSSMQNLAQDQFRAFTLALPPVREQTAIATFLDRETAKIDALVAEQQKLIALLKEKRQALISHAVTKGLDPDVPMNDSGVAWLGEVPAHWDVAPIKYLVKFRSGGTPSKDRLDYWDGEIPWASAKDMKVDRLCDTGDHISDTAIEEGGASLLDEGNVLIVVRGMILARTFPVALTGASMAINQDLKGLQPASKMSSEFLAWYLRGTAAESLSRLDEAGHGTKALRMDAWASLEVSLPPLDEQLVIACALDRHTARIDQLTVEAESAIALLQERRTALISAAVTGKIDVRNLPAASAEPTPEPA